MVTANARTKMCVGPLGVSMYPEGDLNGCPSRVVDSYPDFVQPRIAIIYEVYEGESLKLLETFRYSATSSEWRILLEPVAAAI